MNEEDASRLAAALLRQVRSEFDDRLMEVDAALTAQRFLIEQLLANVFINAPRELDDFMSGLVERTRRAATTAEPASSEHKAEMQARVAARLLRIGDSVRRRLEE